MNYKGVVLRGEQYGATIGTKNQFLISPGQFLLSKIDARNGAFGIVPDELAGAVVTNSFLAFEINEDEVEPEFFNVFLQSPVFLAACVKASKGTTNRKPVDENFFLNYQVNLPPLAEQHALIKQINMCRAKLVLAQGEITHQQTLLGKLKQAILQEAIQGKLTADWRAANPDVEPASELLQRIQAEKARLIAEKKIRKEKTLPEITSEEIPFEIPNGWEWCRLGDLSEKTGSGSTPSGGKSAYTDTGIPFLRSQNVYNAGLILNGVAHIPNSTHERMKGTKVYPDDLLLNITGGSIGRCAVVTNEIDEANINQHVAIIRPIERPLNLFLHSVIISPYFQAKIEDAQTGAGREGLPKNKMDRILIPVPSSQEQAAIVERVEALMATCRELEAEIERSRTHAADLLQAVLKEAFSQ
jgi:type I restriction enzyme S subunit